MMLDAGCSGFLRKPADIRQIRAVLHQYLVKPNVAVHNDTAVYTYI